MSSGLKLLIPGAIALYLASACAPDLDSLSAEYSAIGGTSGSGSSEGGMDNGSGGTPTPVDICGNNKKDSSESDVDCGGTGKCDRCATGNNCTANRDCETGICKTGHCVDPTCNDKLKNQDETGVDCGGSCKPCDLGVNCDSNDDCEGMYCVDHKCGDHCTSGVTDADETAIDCGGSCPDACDNGQGCTEADDCKSKICSNKSCQAPTCSDQVLNQDESDKDCGGICAATKPCAVGKTCNSPADCESWICSGAGKCQADTVIVGANDMIDDFEDGDFNLLALGTPARVGNWYAYGDSTGIVAEDIAMIKRGASTKGIRGTGKDFTGWGSGIGVDLNNKGTKLTWDASAYNSVTFWARVAAPTTGLSVTVLMQDIDTDKLTSGKTCDPDVQGCDHHYFKVISVTTNWQRFVIAFADLMPEPGTKPEPVPAFKPGAISSVQFRVNSGITYDLYVDDVAFVKP